MGKRIQAKQHVSDILQRLRERGWEFEVTLDPLSIGATAPEDVTDVEAEQVKALLESLVRAAAADAGMTADFTTVWVEE